MRTELTARRVQAAMDARGFDQSELARRVGCTSAAINQIVLGKTRQSRFLHKIARELGTTTAFLSGETDDPTSELPDNTLTAEEREFVEQLRSLEPKARGAVLQLLRSLTEAQKPPTVHERAQPYRATAGSRGKL